MDKECKWFTGVVAWFNRSRGYGTIDVDDNSDNPSVFVHWTNIEMEGYKSLNAGDKVKLRIIPDRSGADRMKAAQVKII